MEIITAVCFPLLFAMLVVFFAVRGFVKSMEARNKKMADWALFAVFGAAAVISLFYMGITYY